jgi:hypothetical protein
MPLPCLILTSSYHLATSFVGSERDWPAQSVSFGGELLRRLPASVQLTMLEKVYRTRATTVAYVDTF